MEEICKELFECMMNRIYSANEFDRLGPASERERTVIDRYLARYGEEGIAQ
jgi:hypothetical protein